MPGSWEASSRPSATAAAAYSEQAVAKSSKVVVDLRRSLHCRAKGEVSSTSGLGSNGMSLVVVGSSGGGSHCGVGVVGLLWRWFEDQAVVGVSGGLVPL